MSAIDQDTFIGIEMQSYSSEDIRKGSWLDKLLRRVRLPRMTVIGPADLLQTIHKDGSMVQAMILTRKRIVSEPGGEVLPPLAAPVGAEELEQTAEVSADSETAPDTPLATPVEPLEEPIEEDTHSETTHDEEELGFVYKKIKEEE